MWKIVEKLLRQFDDLGCIWRRFPIGQEDCEIRRLFCRVGIRLRIVDDLKIPRGAVPVTALKCQFGQRDPRLILPACFG